LSYPNDSIGYPAVKTGFPITASGMTNNLLHATWYKVDATRAKINELEDGD
jgi:hypothetical protein